MEDIKAIRDEFRKYLYKLVANNKLSKVDADTQYSDADYPRKHADELGINYWESFKDNTSFENLLSILKEQFEKEGKNPSTIVSYKRALISFKNFINDNSAKSMINNNSEINYYWVCQSQNYLNEKKENSLIAPNTSSPHRQILKELKVGDKIVSYNKNKGIQATLEVTKAYYIDDKNNIIVKVNYNELSSPIMKVDFVNSIKEHNINVFYKNSPIDKNYNINTGYCFKINKELYNVFLNIKTDLSNCTKSEANMTNIPLNQILYGPPGTGKTYNTVVKAISIIDNKNYTYDYKNECYRNDIDDTQITYQELLDRFKKEINKKSDDNSKRIEFVTFHQSYSYEEFVEGIKPDLDNSELKYIREDGIFKRICDNAATKVSNDFEEIYAKFISEFDENYEFKTLQSSFKVRINEKDGLTIRTGDNFDIEKSGTITKEQIKNQTYTSEGRRTKLETITKYLQDKYGLKFNQNKQKQPYVLIIDEINRGDVSKIFGELITLIESDKRIGGKYEMKVTLPYSKESFGVPNNLYIIGTMNTADRSIALLDTALRRRFDFEEMPPEPRLIKDEKIEGTEINPRDLLINLNYRIEEYFDKDHKIGHSYLMDVESKEQLEKAYKNKILPLLNEYFYNDSKTIGKVLNCKEYENKDYLEVLKETQKEYKKGADDQE